MNTAETIIALITAEMGPDAQDVPVLGASFRSLGLDSLDYIKLLAEVEVKFHVDIPNEDAVKFETVQDLCGWIEAHPC